MEVVVEAVLEVVALLMLTRMGQGTVPEEAG
jgi:hypothetical protein